MKNNFGDLEENFSAYKSSRIAILPLAYEGTVTYGKGTKDGPEAIINASGQLELYDEELRQETYRVGIHTLPLLGKEDSSPEEMHKMAYEEASRVTRDGKFLVTLGGEHSLSLAPAKALRERYGDLSFLQLDAHADMRNKYHGSPYNHACIGRRLLELAPLTQVGIRSLDKEQQDFMKRQRKLKTFSAFQMRENKNWMEEAVASLSEHVYLTLDLDVFDPSIVSSVGTPEPGGMGWYKILQFLRLVAEKKKIVGFDIMELAPLVGNIAPDFLAAKLLYKILGYISK